MFRILSRSTLQNVAGMVARQTKFRKTEVKNLEKQFSVLSLQKHPGQFQSKPPNIQKRNLSLVLQNPNLLQIALNLSKNQTRSVTKFSLNKGKRKSVRGVIKRFYRLHWGGWIRTYSGRHKKLWKKSYNNRRRLRQHVLVNSTQSWLLDKMVTKFWRRPKYYVDDPYNPYHVRDEYFATKKRPKLFSG